MVGCSMERPTNHKKNVDKMEEIKRKRNAGLKSLFGFGDDDKEEKKKKKSKGPKLDKDKTKGFKVGFFKFD